MLKRSLSVLLLLLVLIGTAGCAENTQEAESEPSDALIIHLPPFDYSEESAEPNTSDRVDQLCRKAKADAKNADDQQRFEAEAIEWLKSNADNIYDSNDSMEKAIYYGWVLRYYHLDSKDDTFYVGRWVCSAVQFVYPNIDRVEDSVTQYNYRKFKKALEKIS